MLPRQLSDQLLPVPHRAQDDLYVTPPSFSRFSLRQIDFTTRQLIKSVEYPDIASHRGTSQLVEDIAHCGLVLFNTVLPQDWPSYGFRCEERPHDQAIRLHFTEQPGRWLFNRARGDAMVVAELVNSCRNYAMQMESDFIPFNGGPVPDSSIYRDYNRLFQLAAPFATVIHDCELKLIWQECIDGVPVLADKDDSVMLFYFYFFFMVYSRVCLFLPIRSSWPSLSLLYLPRIRTVISMMAISWACPVRWFVSIARCMPLSL